MLKQKPYLNLLLLILLLFSCTRKDPRTEVLALREMSELATVEYVVTKIIRANDNKTWYKIGERKILMSCEASVKAGIDFSKIGEDDITIEGKSIRMVLPKAHLISLNIDPGDVRVEYTETGLFRDKFSAGERDALLAQGEKQIRNSAEVLGVMEAAEANASLFLSNYLKMLGYERINIRYSSTPTPALQ
jgi:hypothetical protein